MKILIITTRYYPYVGGVEAMLDKLVGEFVKNNEVYILTTFELNRLTRKGLSKIETVVDKFKKGFICDLPIEKRSNASIKRIWINFPETFWGYLSFPYRFPMSVRRMVKYINNVKPDVINYHFPDDSCLYVYCAFLFVKYPLVINIHGNDLHVFSKKFLYKKIIYKLLEKSQKVIVNSEYMRSELAKYYDNKEKIELVPNGVDLSEYSGVKSKKYFREDYVFYVGRLVKKKGVDVLIEAFYKANISNLKLLIEGYAEEYDNLVELANKLGLTDRVVFTKGKLSTKEKVQYMKGAIFGVMPSRIEPFGIVSLEYMAAKTPLIASKTGGLNAIIEDGVNGLFFENGNSSDLAVKMEKLYESKQLRNKLVENGASTVIKYDYSNIANQYIDVYSNPSV